MAHRHREALVSSISTISDRENAHAKIGKPLPTKSPNISRRPALKGIENNTAAAVPKKDEDKKETAKIGALKRVSSIKSYSQQRLDIIDPDADCINEPQMVPDYLGDIFDYLCDLQRKFPIKENFLKDHKTTPRMRSILVNWLVQVHCNFKLCLETLHLSISILDRYLQAKPLIGRDTLQLVGVSALLIACKYEEIYVPSLSDFVYVCDDVFSPRQILKAERDILQTLEFNLGKPISIVFLRRYSKLASIKAEQHTFAKYILEQALLDAKLAHIEPSTQAAAACCLAIIVTNSVLTPYPSKHWTATLEHYTKHSYNDLKATVQIFANMLLGAENSKYLHIYNKYQASGCFKVSLLPKTKNIVVRKLAEGWPKS